MDFNPNHLSNFHYFAHKCSMMIRKQNLHISFGEAAYRGKQIISPLLVFHSFYIETQAIPEAVAGVLTSNRSANQLNRSNVLGTHTHLYRSNKNLQMNICIPLANCTARLLLGSSVCIQAFA